MLRVGHFQRRPLEGAYSMERVFEDIRQNLPEDIQVKIYINAYESKGIIPRVKDALRAARNQQDVNHITGDVHYLTYFMQRNRMILTIHDCICLERSAGLKYWLLWLFWFWLPEKRSRFITVISETTRQQLLRYLHCDPDKIRVIYDNVSAEFQPHPQPFRSDCPRILHVGTPENKNLERHVAALDGIGCELIVIGRLNESQQQALVRHNIRYVNRFSLSREQLVEEYRLSDMLLFASTYEGFGLPIVEAQAIGRPVVTSNLWSMPEVAGGAACLVDPFDVESIRAGVLSIMEDSLYRQHLIELGFENVKRFGGAAIAFQYETLYREVLEGL